MTTQAQERGYWEKDASPLDFHDVADPEDYGATIIARALDPQPYERVLDLGCGFGRLTTALAHRYPDCWFHGVDIALRGNGLYPPPENVAYSINEGRTIHDAASYDCAFSVALFQHLPPLAVRGYITQLGLVRRAVCFQFVEGTTHADFEHKYETNQIRSWCYDAGWSYTTLAPDERHDEWQWMVCSR